MWGLDKSKYGDSLTFWVLISILLFYKNGNQEISAMAWIFVSPPAKKNSYVEDLTPSVMVFGEQDLGRWLGLDGDMRVRPLQEDLCPYYNRKRPEQTLCPP